MNAIDFHERIATAFSNRYRSSKAFQERFYVWTTLFATHINATDRVLDLGCGSGIFSNYLAEKGCIVTGIDGSAAMLAICQRDKPGDNVRYFLATLPLVDPASYGEYNVVVRSRVLENMVAPDTMLQQARILLRPNGLLFVSIPNQKSIYRMIERILFSLLKRPAYCRHSRYTTTKTALDQQLRALGFEILDVSYFSGQDPLSRRLKPWLAEAYSNTLLVGVYRRVATA